MLRYLIILPILFFTIETVPVSALENEVLLTDVLVNARVDFDSGRKIYRYKYTLSNGKNSRGRIDSFVVTIRIPDGAERLSEELLFKRTPDPVASLPDELSEALKRFQEVLPPIVPVSLSSPSTWVSITLGNARWGSDEGAISPGELLSGFVIESPGLPTIREFHADPKVNDPPAGRELIFVGKTIGPTAPPSVIVYEEFIGNLSSLGKEAHKLGWIKESGFLEALEEGLMKAKDAMEVFKLDAAKEVISSLLAKVETAKEGGLTPEGYALLKYNLIYLLKKI